MKTNLLVAAVVAGLSFATAASAQSQLWSGSEPTLGDAGESAFHSALRLGFQDNTMPGYQARTADHWFDSQATHRFPANPADPRND